VLFLRTKKKKRKFFIIIWHIFNENHTHRRIATTKIIKKKPDEKTIVRVLSIYIKKEKRKIFWKIF